MTPLDIEKLAEAVRREHQLKIPVDVARACSEEGIELAPGHYSSNFHGRIEYLSEEGVFVIFHPIPNDVSEGRVRFTIAHELGHYFIEQHRNLIVAGDVHNSVEAFAPVRNRIEKEADSFASSFLMPEKAVLEMCGSKGYLDTRGVRKLADLCGVSLRAAAYRYTKLTEEPCVLIFADSGVIECAFHSDEADARWFGGLGIREIPVDAAARKCILGDVYQTEGKQTDTTSWFSPRQAFAKLWEDSMRLASGNRTLTILSWADYKPDEE